MSTATSPTLTPLLTRDAPYLDGVPDRPYLDPGWRRIASGVHVPVSQWVEASAVERHLVRIEAAQRRYGKELVLVGVSAALALGLPVIGQIPRRVQCLGAPGQRRRTSLLHRHELSGCQPLDCPGRDLCVAPVPMVLLGVAASQGIVGGVAAMDAALRRRLCTRRSLKEAMELLPERSRGRVAASQAVLLADGRAESPGESMSRVRMWQARLPRPDLQRTVLAEGAPGVRYRVDFIWQDLGVVGEFDGRVKYQRQSFGRDPEQVLWEERTRERELVRMGLQVARWTWDEAWRDGGTTMVRELERLGVRPGRHRWSER